MPMNPNYQRCQQIIDGAQCGTRASSERRCRICEAVQAPGQALRGGRCDPCRKAWERTGRERVATSMLALAEGLIVEGGAWHGQVDV